MRTGVIAPVAAPLVLALALLSACGGSGLPEFAAGTIKLCQPLARAESFTYTISYFLDTPTQEGYEPDPDVDIGDYALQPGSPDFRLAQTLEGTLNHPDKLDVVVKTEGGGDPFHIIFYEDRQWGLLGDNWSPTSQPVPFPVLHICDAVLDGLDLDGVTPVEDSVNGEDVLRYEFADVELETAETIWGATSDMARVLETFNVTLWLTEDERPVQIETRSESAYPSGRPFTMELTLEVRDVNNAPRVEPPIQS